MRAALALLSLLALTAAGDTRTICANATGSDRGRFYTFWHDTSAGCMTLAPNGHYAVTWHLGANGNLVAGTGWKEGSPRRVVRYLARSFEPGSNGYLALYGWSRAPLVEYYIVDNWGAFTPPGPSGELLGTLESDGGTYRVFRTRRTDAPSIAGRASFDQYWSVRTRRRPVGGESTITVANHAAAWRRIGLRLGRLGYQVVATEGFGSTGRSDIVVRSR